MKLDPDILKNDNRLFHVSEQAGIKEFKPRPSPSYFAGITGDVVFAITENLLHNYLLPRDCPRITYYASAKTTPADIDKFMGDTSAGHVIIVESGWYEVMMSTTLFCYELPVENFSLIDECAGYYISYKPVIPLAVRPVAHIIPDILSRNVELRFTPSLTDIAKAISSSSLNFSLIRMRNAKH
ncbi:DUF6886 family protein [Mucilaginibacter lappiensis]|uniref:Uncharacterized protein n=1 Tax=Mucilaginibacter lappiensis TaxID=354630 RepID=A0A841JC18_9SPHI|nr:DUF6886 family protein [Mucilaginibacter lappiensis]MBB6126138.1 hypothetical protein [Mucilaginibacter lappiensis]